MKEYILITGASSGIGRQCAIHLSKDYNLILCARSIEKLNETKSLCINPNNHFVLNMDLSDIAQISNNLSDFLVEKGIVVDKFLHCAGAITLLPAKSFDYLIAKNIFDINLFSSMEIVKNLIKKKPNQKALKNVVFISALYSKKAVVGNSLYAASKSAIDSYMRCMAKELAPNVRLNSILPGAIDTPMSRATFTSQEDIDKMKREYPLGFGDIIDVVNMVEFLFSEKSKWITGQQISVDGGASV